LQLNLLATVAKESPQGEEKIIMGLMFLVFSELHHDAWFEETLLWFCDWIHHVHVANPLPEKNLKVKLLEILLNFLGNFQEMERSSYTSAFC
jgi:hypothetical protein